MRRFFFVVVLAGLVHAAPLLAQHGVIREYAALAPGPEATALRPLFDAPLTDTSICVGPDRAYYLTGSAVTGGAAHASATLGIWRSADMREWRMLRTLDWGADRFLSPEIHWLQGAFWLTLGRAGGGTELLRFESSDLAASRYERKQITPQGTDPSIFLDEDGAFYWVLGGGAIARMKANPLDGLAAGPRAIRIRVAGNARQQSQQSVEHTRGAHLAKMNGRYHLFITGRLLRNGLGRTGLAEGADDVLVAASEKPDSGYGDFYVAFPHAGQTTIFRDPAGELWATFSGTDSRAIFTGRPGAFRIEQVPAHEPRWPIGFSGLEKPQRFPFGLMLRPDTSFIYERGMGFARAVPLDKVPGQRADVSWMRDTFIMVGHDGNYYLTGTSGNMDGINLWKSADLQRFEFVRQVWTPQADPSKWYNNVPDRLFWAPELHYINGTYWIAFCISAGAQGKNSLLKSTSGLAEGPYEPAFPENHGVDERIDASLFEDTDGSVYYVWQDGMIRKLNAAMNGFDGEAQKIIPTDGQRVGYEGATLVKIGSWYVLTAAEWNGGANRSDGTYDMMYSCSKSLLGPYRPRRVAVPHAGHGAIFKDKAGRWNAALFGNDRTAPFRAMPGFVPVETRDTGDDLVIRPADAPAGKPNILVILADDLGYADVGFNGCKDIPTPNLDTLARSGVRCTSGYVTHPFCSPTRAGFLTGRYQQRFGHENNPAWLPESTVAGLPLSQATLPQVLKTAGYATGCVGKWHLGAHPQFHPNRRGFDEYFGLLGGGHVYLPGVKGSVEYQIPMDRNGKSEPLTEYLTTVLAREGSSFIMRHKGQPWFLYLTFNAPHTPLQVTDPLMERVKHISDETRRGYAGLVVGLDDAVGVVMNALKESGQAENTLVFFLSDNGGPVSVTHSDNSPLRGAKGDVFEGGIRVPFVVSWPGRLPQGKDYVQPVISLDVFATAAALANASVPAGHKLEGTNILPYLAGQQTDSPHNRLFWRAGGGAKHAVREGDWKLVGGRDVKSQLFNLAADLSESRDLAAEQPEVLTRLSQAYAEWNKDNVAPLFESPKANQPKAAKKAQQK